MNNEKQQDTYSISGDYIEQKANYFSVGVDKSTKIESNYTQSNTEINQIAIEIKEILEKICANNPTTTLDEKVAVVKKAELQIKQNPILKNRIIGALTSGGKEALKKLVKHPLVDIFFSSIEGWNKGV